MAPYTASWRIRQSGSWRLTNAARNRPPTTHPAIEADWRDWLTTLFPRYVTAPFASHHERIWEWVWAIARGTKPTPLVAILPRGAAKSTSAELATVAVGARGARKYGLYISETQDQADGHVQNIAGLLESPGVEAHYPALASRRVGKYGNSQGWRRNRLSTAAGFTVDAIGFDTAARGIRIDEDRPDFIVVDDIDNQKDSPERVEKKIGILTRALLPAGSNDVAVLAVQNLIHTDSIFSRLADGRADFLADREVIGPIPAVEHLETEERDGRHYVTGGIPTWEGQSLATVQAQINEWGWIAFVAEAQQQVSVLRSRIYTEDWWAEGRNRYHVGDGAEVAERFLFVDSAMKDTATSDYSACLLIELMNDYRARVRPLWNERLLFPDLIARIAATASAWRYDARMRDVLRTIAVEDKNSGTSAVQTIEATMPAWMGERVIGFMPNGDKLYRARQASGPCGQNSVLLPHPHADVPDLRLLEHQLFNMPNVEHDDYADTFSMGIIFLHHLLKRGFEGRTTPTADDAA